MIAVTISRTLIAAFAFTALAGCAGGSTSSDLSPSTPEPPPPQAAAAPPSPQGSPPPAPSGRAAQSAAQQPAPPPPAKQAASTPEEVKGQCWMKYENDRRAKNIDERLKLVEKCVDDTMRNQPRPLPAR